MGKKTIYFAMGSSLLTGFISIVSIFLPWNALTFNTGKTVPVGSLRIRLLGAQMDFRHGIYCLTVGEKISPGSDFCEDMRGSHDLQELSHMFCAQMVKDLFRGSCSAFSSCYAMGLLATIVCVVNLILQGTAAWMINHYMTNSPKKKYREVSFILVVVGTVLLTMCLLLWFGVVSLAVDNIDVAPLIDWALDVSQGWSTSTGYWLLWCAWIVQVVQIILYRYGKISDEVRLMEAKMQQEFEAELAMAGGGDPYGGGYGGGYNDPYAQENGYGGQANGYGGGYANGGGYPSGGYAANPYGAPPGSSQPGAYQPQQMPASWGVSMQQPMPSMPGGYR
mmetsp:Transcript_70649/g.133275  ORF Transcript_70649/g.133275 Transcript_70649/m.133275 type:complete len:335 (-) Transcript_70649:102-1106(-)